MSRTKHAVTRCGWCGQKIKRGQSIKGRDRGKLVRFCPDGGCVGKPRRRNAHP